MRTRNSHHKITPLRAAALMLFCGSAMLVGCADSKSGSRYAQKHDSAPQVNLDPASVQDAVPRVEPKSRYGNATSYVVRGKRYHTLPDSRGYQERGVASWYGTKFHGHRTSSGEVYDMYAMSAAHKSLPLPTYARVTNLRNGKSVIVKINDRGPFHDNRLIDLSYAAATKLDILGQGTGLVEVKAIDAKQYLAERQKPKIMPSQPKVAGQQSVTAAAEPAVYLQLGAFSERSNAERLRTRLASVDLPGTLHISEAVSRQKRVYRVRVGPLDTVESADQATQILATQGIKSSRLIID